MGEAVKIASIVRVLLSAMAVIGSYIYASNATIPEFLVLNHIRRSDMIWGTESTLFQGHNKKLDFVFDFALAKLPNCTEFLPSLLTVVSHWRIAAMSSHHKSNSVSSTSVIARLNSATSRESVNATSLDSIDVASLDLIDVAL